MHLHWAYGLYHDSMPTYYLCMDEKGICVINARDFKETYIGCNWQYVELTVKTL